MRVNKDNPASLNVMMHNGGYIKYEDGHKYYVRIKNRGKWFLRKGYAIPMFCAERFAKEWKGEEALPVDADISLGKNRNMQNCKRNEAVSGNAHESEIGG